MFIQGFIWVFSAAFGDISNLDNNYVAKAYSFAGYSLVILAANFFWTGFLKYHNNKRNSPPQHLTLRKQILQRVKVSLAAIGLVLLGMFIFVLMFAYAWGKAHPMR